MREDQIVRYGRQILLRGLGGKGQERLLASPVRVRGSGPSIDDAVAYLLAGGTPLVLPPGATFGGFLAGAPVDALNPDAIATGSPVAELLPAELSSEARSQVVVGAGLAFRTEQACDGCWAEARAALQPGAVPAVGSLAALAVQRVVLGWSEPLGLVHWNGERFETKALPPCRHGTQNREQ